MYKKTFFSKIMVVSLSAIAVIMMAFSGCGKEDKNYDVSDYQNGDNNSTEKGSESEADITEASTKEENETSQSGGGSLADKLGGMQLSFADNFMIGSTPADINVNYFAARFSSNPEDDKIQSHRVVSIKEEDVKEEELVKAFFGDSGKRIEGNLNVELGDSARLIEAIYLAVYEWEDNAASVTGNFEIPTEYQASVDEMNYYIHTYAGLYNNTEYQLLIGYNKEKQCEKLALFPKNYGDITGNQEIAGVGYYYPGAGLYYRDGNEKDLEKLESIDTDVILGNMENSCKASDDAMKDMILQMFRDKLGINIVEDYFSLYDKQMNIMDGPVAITSDSMGNETVEYLTEDFENKINKVDLVFMPESFDNQLIGAVKAGYVVEMQTGYEGFKILDPDNSNESIDPFMVIVGGSYPMNNTGTIWVDDSGVIGFNMMIYYSFEELMSEDVPLLSFENAMKAFEEQTSQNMDVTQLGISRNDNGGKIFFKTIDLVEYMLPSPAKQGEYTLVPAWAISSMNSTIVQSTVIINAMDGTLIDILY